MMRDPFGSMQGFMGQFRGFMRNPMQMLQQRMGIPQGMNGPNQVIQYLMGNGSLTQEQYNAAREAAGRIQDNPQFKQMFGGGAHP